VTAGIPPTSLPLLHRRLLDLNALTSEDIQTLATRLSVATLADLDHALDDGRAAREFTSPVLSRLVVGAAAVANELRPLTLGRAVDLLESLQGHIQQICPGIEAVVAAGDVRRFEPLVTSLVLVGRSSDPAAVVDALGGSSWIESVSFRTPRRALIVVQGHEIDVRVAAPDEYGTVLFLATGTREHVRAVIARRGALDLAAREHDLYAHAALAWIAPELRHDTGEIAAAAHGSLPRLVEKTDIRGDLHMHTTYSDGQDSLESVVAACAALGYEYLAITDHSENAGASRTVSRKLLEQQRQEIERLRRRYPRMAILHGIEVDILPDGRLDFADEVLERLDIVLASLHDAAGHDASTLTRRCLAAIRHPLVNVITHPSNQLVGRRNGYELDYPTIYAAAAESGTALEVDGAPSHLDLDGEHARAAIAAGVTLTIDSDCHRARALARQMDFGVGTARRGWVEARHVLNAQPIEAIRRFVAAKRSR
jgi:DNA polymerase (family 10)